MGLGAEGWALLLVPTILGFLVMVLYGYWDKITGKEYYVDADILAYDEDLIEELKKEGKA
ncbi:hypothetical protein, conserved [Thermococcus kodakarensis KOD1]|uniref:Uncharacterized protein n=3 Tax=Thermococcaceae TaxID=2259 RepID=Q5JFD9_THEKO|nr:hypothetical protein [Thermococcus kodakarensis]AMQ18256.1 hypothetical protein A0127_03265 [Thermococcus peptonophilus]WCN28223.1 hypothetical protein POG15_00600 [Thermococcus kodakarensis]WCN30519.1 hypothetical protein POG21_00600 [Thermococcus kodakarensis]BAD84303.1 hypothetical protein, conserved [Thermococcus kodakarensis KOD1]